MLKRGKWSNFVPPKVSLKKFKVDDICVLPSSKEGASWVTKFYNKNCKCFSSFAFSWERNSNGVGSYSPFSMNCFYIFTHQLVGITYEHSCTAVSSLITYNLLDYLCRQANEKYVTSRCGRDAVITGSIQNIECSPSTYVTYTDPYISNPFVSNGSVPASFSSIRHQYKDALSVKLSLQLLLCLL